MLFFLLVDGRLHLREAVGLKTCRSRATWYGIFNRFLFRFLNKWALYFCFQCLLCT